MHLVHLILTYSVNIQRGKVSCFMSHKFQVVELGFEFNQCGSSLDTVPPLKTFKKRETLIFKKYL
jgi:hypothetical protein